MKLILGLLSLSLFITACTYNQDGGRTLGTFGSPAWLKFAPHKDLVNYYFSPGNIVNLIKFAESNNYDLLNMSLKDFLYIIIDDKVYKKDNIINYLILDLIEFYFNKIDKRLFPNINDKYNLFLKRASNTKRFNLDEESLFMEFKEDILNG